MTTPHVRRSQKLELTWFNKDQALIPAERGKYKYDWTSPTDPRYCETHTLVMDDYVTGEQQPKRDGVVYTERADLEPTTDNLLVRGESGDLLEALTRVPELADKYVGKVKCVYIDPPFNTEKTFTHYEDNLEHSIWLTMMRDRLVHLHRLLGRDGSIWVHLDDSENHRMRCLLDEVFGPGNFVAEMVWEKAYAPSNNANGIPAVTDTIAVYRKSDMFVRNKLPRTEAMDSRYSNPDNSIRGCWKPDNKSARHNAGKRQHPGVYGIQHPVTGEMIYPASSSNWRFDQGEMLRIMREWGPYVLGEVTSEELSQRRRIEGPGVELRPDVRPLVVQGWGSETVRAAMDRYRQGNWPIYYPGDGGKGGFQRKIYLDDVAGSVPKNLLLHSEVGHNDQAKREVQALSGGSVAFSTPKPERLLERIIHIATDPGDIVLDVFGGSGTTAAVAQKMGRRWVTCELVDDTVDRFLIPRLTKVVCGDDPGGITVAADERVFADPDNEDRPSFIDPDDQDADPTTDVEDDEVEELDPDRAFEAVRGLNVAKQLSPHIEDVSNIVAASIRKDKNSDQPALSADEAAALRALMKKLSGSADGAHLFNTTEAAVKHAKSVLKTKKIAGTINWRGGGGFQVAHLSHAVFDYDPDLGMVTLTEHAHGDTLIASVAAQLKFTLTPDDPYFHGTRGRMRLIVADHMVTCDDADRYMAHLGEGESVTIAATGIADGVREHVRRAGIGASVCHVPDDIFRFGEDQNR